MHTGPKRPKNAKTIYNYSLYIWYMFLGVFGVKESIFGVKIEIGAKRRAYTGFSRWAGAGFLILVKCLHDIHVFIVF